MRRDMRGIWMGRIWRRGNSLDGWFSGVMNRWNAFLWGVRVGRNCRFYGRLHFRRVEYSTIAIGDDCTFRSGVRSNLIGLNRPCMISTLRRDAAIRIGSGCGMSGTVIGAAQCIEVGNSVLIGANTTITDTDWHGTAPADRRKEGASEPVIIEDNVLIGMNCIVLKGVTIGRNSIIGAGSVVTRSIPENVVAGGNPARILKELERKGMAHA